MNTFLECLDTFGQSLAITCPALPINASGHFAIEVKICRADAAVAEPQSVFRFALLCRRSTHSTM